MCEKMQLKTTLGFLLILFLAFTMITFSEAYAQTSYYVGLQGIAWDHSTLAVLIVTPQKSVNWWTSSYLNATLRAIGQWNNAIHDFSLNYSGFNYLTKVTLIPTVANTLRSGFDIYVNWTETSVDNTTEIGISRSVYRLPSTIINNTIILSAEDSQGYVLNELDMQNIALHELGHSLGLDHSNYNHDVMYPTYTPKKTVLQLSTLDVYGVSKVFAWISTSSQLSPSNIVVQKSMISLPEDISYVYLPISYDNLPSDSVPENSLRNPYLSSPLNFVQMLTNYCTAFLTLTLQSLRNLEILVPLTIMLVMLLIIVPVFVRSQKKKRKPLDSCETAI